MAVDTLFSPYGGVASGYTHPRLLLQRTGTTNTLSADLAANTLLSGTFEFEAWGKGGTGGCTLNVVFGGLSLFSYGVSPSEQWVLKCTVLRTGSTSGIFATRLGATHIEGDCNLDWSRTQTINVECRRPIDTGQYVRALIVKHFRL